MSGLMDFMLGRVAGGGSILFATSGYSNRHVHENGGDAPATDSQSQT